MELTNEFRVGAPVERAWAVLTDVERIAPCLPGAQLLEVEGEEYRGVVRVKVGPITAQYKGKAAFVEKDDAAHRAVLRAEGRDTRGQGNANATITAVLVADGDGTAVSVVTDLAVTGRVAQFGRGVLADVSAKLLTQFVEALEADVLAREAEADQAATSPIVASSNAEERPPATGAAAEQEAGAADRSSNGDAPRATIRTIDSAPAQPVDLLEAAGGSVIKRIGPIAGAALFALWVFWRRRRRGVIAS